MRRVAEVAAELGTTIVRVFSFFIPAGEPPERYRGQVIDRMGALARIAEEHGLILAHENEKGIYGDVPDRCADLITAVGSPALRATFDPANFVQCGSPALLRRVRPDPAPTWSTCRSRTRWPRPARSSRPGRATGSCARRWPRCGTRASRASCRSNRTWRRPDASAASAARRALFAPLRL